MPLAEPCLQQNFSFIKRFRDCSTFLYPLPLENVLLPNSFTHASYTHQQYNCSGNERAKAANWDGNNISNPATLAVPSNLTTISRYMNARTSTLTHAHTHTDTNAETTRPQTDTFDLSAQLSFLVGLIREALCECAAVTLEALRGSTGISLPSVVSYAKLQLKVTPLRSHGF